MRGNYRNDPRVRHAGFTHMATCPFRPAGKPLTDRERDALARTGR